VTNYTQVLIHMAISKRLLKIQSIIQHRCYDKFNTEKWFKFWYTLRYYRPKNSPTKILQHFRISGRTNLTHTYVCFLMYTDNLHHKFFYHIWYNDNPYHLTPYLNTNKRSNISHQNCIDSCVIPVGTAFTLLPTTRCLHYLPIYSGRKQWCCGSIFQRSNSNTSTKW